MDSADTAKAFIGPFVILVVKTEAVDRSIGRRGNLDRATGAHKALYHFSADLSDDG
jgi:hypothetical protein